MNPLQDRLRTFVGTLGISVQEFERQSGIKAGTASRMTEKSYSTTFHRIQTSFPQLNMVWLKTGEGEMLIPTPQEHYEIGIGIGKQLGGKNNFNIDIKEDPEEYEKLAQELCDLRREIEHLKKMIEEKDARINELNISLDRERKMNDYFMGNKH